MKLLTDEICRGSAERDAAKKEVVNAVVSLARAGSLDEIISRSSNLNKGFVMNAVHVVFIDDPMRQNGLSDSYYIGEPSIIFCGMTPIYHQDPSSTQYDVIDRDTILEFGSYILFAGSYEVAFNSDDDSPKSNRLFVMENTEQVRAHLYKYKSEEHTKNVEMWMVGGTEPADIPELAPMLDAAEEVRKKVMAENAELKVKLMAERAAAKLSATA